MRFLSRLPLHRLVKHGACLAKEDIDAILVTREILFRKNVTILYRVRRIIGVHILALEDVVFWNVFVSGMLIESQTDLQE